MKLLINGCLIFAGDVIEGIRTYMSDRQYMMKGDKVVVRFEDGGTSEYELDKERTPVFRRQIISKKKKF